MSEENMKNNFKFKKIAKSNQLEEKSVRRNKKKNQNTLYEKLN